MPDPTIVVNGQPHPLESAVPLAELLDTLGLAGKPVVIELNGRALLRDDHQKTTVQPGSTLEIITLAAGG